MRSTDAPSKLSAPLAGSDRPLIVTSGTAVAHTPGRLSTKDDAPNSPVPQRSFGRASGCSGVARGVSVVRLPQVHDPLKQGLITYLIAAAREKSRRMPATGGWRPTVQTGLIADLDAHDFKA